MDNGGYKVGQKVETISDKHTVDGTLYKGEIVTIESIGFPDKDMRVKDTIGRIWYLNFGDVSKI